MTRKRKSTIEQEWDEVTEEEVAPTLEPAQFIPTGSTLLNLAMTDHIDGGWPVGRLSNLIGDSSAGKSFLAKTAFAEMTAREEFNDFRMIYDDAEEADSFDNSYLFGDECAERIDAPGYDDEDGEPVYSDTVQDFDDNINNAIDGDVPFLYVLDSFDSVTSEEELAKAEEHREARKKGKEAKGTYGMEKAKWASSLFRRIVGGLPSSDGALIVVSQTRDDINPMSFSKKTRSGGKALKFYATFEMWAAVAKKIKKKDRIIGVMCKIKITKNKITGKVREVEFPIYYDYGVDDLDSCIEFLLKEKHWNKSGNSIVADEFGGKMTKQKLIDKIEDEGLEDKLRNLVQKVWNALEDSLKLKRKRKY